MEWMRCNNCWLKVENKQSQFHLTQCGHVYCDKCISKAEEKCYQCGSVGTISLPLMSPQTAHYFTQPTDLLEKVLQAQQFQKAQLSLCLKRSDANDSKYQTLKEAYWVSTENLKKVCQKYNKLKMMVAAMHKEKKLASQLTPSQFRTPPNQMNHSKCSENHAHGYYQQRDQDMSKNNDEVFRVPTITKVPRSAGYFTASSQSTNSSYRMNTPSSTLSRY